MGDDLEELKREVSVLKSENQHLTTELKHSNDLRGADQDRHRLELENLKLTVQNEMSEMQAGTTDFPVVDAFLHGIDKMIALQGDPEE